MGQPKSVQIQSEINPTDAAASSREVNGSSLVDTMNLNGHKTPTYENKIEDLTSKTISTISSEGHDFVDSDDETVTSFDEEDDFDSDDEDEEFEEFLLERKMILQDARKLATLAGFYQCPEKSVTVDGFAKARCYFDRFSANESEAMGMQEERDAVLQDVAALKKLAMDYLHPERPVEVADAMACARSYFDRYSAPVADLEEEAEYQKIIQDMKGLKTTASWYLHPEKPVESDGFAPGRDYYSRPSAIEYVDDFEVDIERERIMKDVAALKTAAEWYLKPELPVNVDATCFGRNYFSRPSAPEQMDDDEDAREELELIIHDVRGLKTTAEWYLKPELPVVTSDPSSYGRNFFSRASAQEYEEDSDERTQVLAEVAHLKQVAEWYMYPEKPVVANDPAACARNYFNRASAPETEDEDYVRERDQIFADLSELKKIAGWYMHPEKPVVCEDPCAFGRNYFERPSAPVNEDEDERQQVLAEAAGLKKVAVWYLHPEKPVVCDDPCASARCYFTRPSAPEYEEEVEMEERERVLSESLELKKYADWYLNPQKPVQCDGLSLARNYYSRPSAIEQEDEDLSEERQLVLEEAMKLKNVAEWYLCPEKPVHTDGFATARNYFNRPSAPEPDMDMEERNSILADAKALKQYAEWYHCPEKQVEVDATACARNYFTRPSAPEYESDEINKERDAILADANKLKEIAGWYHHPEKPVTSSIAVTRNYFTRPSAEEHIETMEHEDEKAAILADVMQLKKLAVDYLHPEMPVQSSVNCVRNYFDRPSAPGHSDLIHSEGHAINEHGFLEHHIEHHDAHHSDYYAYHDYNYHHHHDDDHSHGTQSDHFEMDEDVFHNFRQSMVAHQEHQVQTVPIIKEIDEKAGNLSRSPSDVMLFDESVM